MDLVAEEIESTISYTADTLREEAYAQLWNEQTSVWITLSSETIYEDFRVCLLNLNRKWLAKS